MQVHAPWLYALPQSVRQLLIGTGVLPSLVSFVSGRQSVTETLRRAWREGLSALVAHVEAAKAPVQEAGPAPELRGRRRWHKRPAHGVLSP